MGDAPETFLSALEITNASDTVYAVVDAPEWGGKIRVRSLTGVERGEVEAALAKDKHGKMDKAAAISLVPRTVAMAMVDGKGQRLFADVKQGATVLGAKNAAPSSRAFDAILRLSGMTDEELKVTEGNLREIASDAGSSE